MPRPKPETPRVPVLIRFDLDLLARIDARDGASRGAKIAELIELGLRVHETTAAVVARPQTTAKPSRAVAPAKTTALGEPIEDKPWSNLKKR